MTQHYIAFPVTDSILGKSNRFFEAVAASDEQAGAIFSDIIREMTSLLIDTLLLKPLEMSNIGGVGEKFVRVCASTGLKVANMLSGKTYNKASMKELQEVAAHWQNTLQDFAGDGKWCISTVINEQFAARLESLIAERGTGPEYKPRDQQQVVKAYELLSDVIIDDIFLAPTRKVKKGMVTESLLSTGVASVKSAVHAVLHNVIGKLPPKPLADYFDYTLQFYVKQ